MIIKITSRTRRISINGTTFGSAATPRLPPTSIPMSHLAKMPREEDSHIQRTKLPSLLSCFELGCDQADLVDSRAAHDVDGASHVHEHGFVVALHERDLLGALLEDLLNARAKLIPIGIFLIDFYFTVFGDLHDDGFVFQLDILLLIWIRLRHKCVETLWNERRDHHENDDQHQKNINQRHYVGRCERSALLSSNIHPHDVIS